MAIGAGAAGAWAASNATTHTVTLPAHAAGDMLIVVTGVKAATMTSLDPLVTTPASGWTRAGHGADGTTATGNGTGSVNVAVFYKEAASGAETNPVITWGGSQTGAPGCGVGLCFTKAGGETWAAPVAVFGAQSSALNFSATMASNPGITAGDWGVIANIVRDDSALTVPTWSATGLTLAGVVEYPATALLSGTSNDIAADSAYRSVTSGTASAAPVVTGTCAFVETGTSMLTRLRVATSAEGLIPYVGGGYYG